MQQWAEAVPLPVHGVAPRVQTEPDDPNRYTVVEGLTVYAPAGTSLGAHDRVVWADREYEVDGDVADWARGPWANPAAGVTFDLTLVKG